MILAASDGVWDVEENEGVVEEMTAHPDVSEVRISAAAVLLAPTHARSQSCRHLLMRCLAKWKSLFGEPNGAFRSLAEHRQRVCTPDLPLLLCARRRQHHRGGSAPLARISECALVQQRHCVL